MFLVLAARWPLAGNVRRQGTCAPSTEQRRRRIKRTHAALAPARGVRSTTTGQGNLLAIFRRVDERKAPSLPLPGDLPAWSDRRWAGCSGDGLHADALASGRHLGASERVRALELLPCTLPGTRARGQRPARVLVGGRPAEPRRSLASVSMPIVLSCLDRSVDAARLRAPAADGNAPFSSEVSLPRRISPAQQCTLDAPGLSSSRAPRVSRACGV